MCGRREGATPRGLWGGGQKLQTIKHYISQRGQFDGKIQKLNWLNLFFFFFFYWKKLKKLFSSQISSSSQLIVLASSTQSWCSSPLLWIAQGSDCLSLFDWALEWRMWPCVYLHSRTWLVRGHSKSQINSAPEGWGGSQKKETLKITTLHQCGAYEIKPPPEHVRLHVLLFFFHPQPDFPEWQDCEDKAMSKRESQCMSEPTFG